MLTRPTTKVDVVSLQVLLDAIELFPAEMLPDLLAADDGAIWLTCERTGRPVGFCYAVPEQLADGTWNMRAIGIDPEHHRSGVGSELVRSLEEHLCAQRQRILIVDTSSTPDYDRARAFYRNNGYADEARIRDFWGPGDDKVTFWKRLA